MTEAEAIALLAHAQSAYLRALGANDMAAWAACFADPGSYICTTLENEDQGLPLALMMDDSHGRILDRVKYITEVWAGTFEDYRSRHVVQPLGCRTNDGVILGESNFIVAYTSASGRSGLLATGTYRDEVIVTESGPRFRAKTAILDTTITPRYLVYPI